jgi:hypothetical protein
MAKSKSGVSKAQWVRDALGSLGNDAKPAAIQDHIKTAGGPDIPTVMISSYKSNMKNKSGGKRGGKKGGGRAGRSGGGGSKGDIFADIATVRGLLNKHGKSGLVKLIDVIG